VIGIARDHQLSVMEDFVMGGAQHQAISSRVFATTRLSRQVMDIHIPTPSTAGNPATTTIAQHYRAADSCR
jgi:hypothetical protein